MTFHRRIVSGALVASLLFSVSACRLSDDAIAASQQMTATAAGLTSYYAALDGEVGDTIALFELDGAISGIPFSAEDRKLPETTRAEIKKRKELAATLGTLAGSMQALSDPKMSGVAATSATKLGQGLVAVKALPGGSPIPDALGKAAGVLLSVVQQHDEKKAARAMDDTLQALSEFFEKEKPAYDSITRTYVRQAGQVAKDLITANALDTTPMLSPALRPFGLTALSPSPALQEKLKTLAVARLDGQTADAVHRAEAASVAMLDALQEMSARVHQLATEKMMRLRGNPFSLELVESWAESLSASLL